MWDVARLNVLLELFSECAGIDNLETLLRTAAGRLRWIIDFDQCVLAIGHGESCECWIAERSSESLSQVSFAELSLTKSALVSRVLESGAPANLPSGVMSVPLQVGKRTLGALCFSTAGAAYTQRDIRLAHHAGQYLGTLISRLELEEQTRQLLRNKDEILAVLSHELRNPLAPIVTAVHLLRRRADGEAWKEVDVIERQARHLVRLVDDLLDVARLTRGKIRLDRAPVAIAEVVARTVEMASPLIKQHRHSLSIDVPSSGLIVDADASRLVQVLSNLLNNAAYYKAPGGHIGLAARRDDDGVVIEVWDDGVGIALEAQAKIFGLFVQGPDRPTGQGGLGLGLVVVKQLTELHGGSISVASEGRGQGTKFTLRLPALPVGFVEAAPLAVPALGSRTDTPQRVLLVDDNADALGLLSVLVETAGHEIVMAHDGPEALAALARFHPSVAVLDLGLPVMDGYELAARLRARDGGEALYLVALTGYGRDADRERTRAAGFDEHLVKPVDVDVLLRIIGQRRSLPPAAPS